MKKVTAFFLVALFTLIAGVVSAQEDETVVIELPDILVLCPGENALPSAREAASLVVEFDGVNDVMVVPFGQVSVVNGVTVVTIGRVQLTCDSTIAEFAAINRSEAVAVNETAPQPETPIGVAEIQEGYLVVTTLNANVRSCDLPTCSQVALVGSGDFLVALGTNGESGDRLWWYVQIGDTYGWIWDGIVAIRGDLSDLPIVETAGEPTAPTVYIGFTGNPVYSSLNPDGVGLCSVQGDSVYPLLGRNFDTSWVYVEVACTDGTIVTGWMNAENVFIRNPGEVFVPFLDNDGNPE